ncbi:MAG: pyridoxamine 5'-phosphate oxidase family protein [Sphingomonadales bacterium]|nr:pyridoxamine 5'-phosphate oxidase family protein [Sphingomonadales bacterium]MDE2569156.1 pyridoxamine 5'-phosphate oxidase family protein [Sphingomonadales bacterium]
MADFTDHITPEHEAMIAKQAVFFVATAAAEGRINLSPKGYDTFRVLSPTRVCWLDLGGSGNETNAHLLADGRVTVMMCNFGQPPLILRLYGRAVPVLPMDAGWDEIAAHYDLLPGTRQIFDMKVESVQTSCGWGVPVMALEAERPTLVKYHARADPREWAVKVGARDRSIDGLPTRPTDRYIAGS